MSCVSHDLLGGGDNNRYKAPKLLLKYQQIVSDLCLDADKTEEYSCRIPLPVNMAQLENELNVHVSLCGGRSQTCVARVHTHTLRCGLWVLCSVGGGLVLHIFMGNAHISGHFRHVFIGAF